MNKKIIEFAEQAGAKYYAHADYLLTTDLDIEQFASLIRQDEREVCAEIAYSMAYSEDEAEEIAKAIRARVR